MKKDFKYLPNKKACKIRKIIQQAEKIKDPMVEYNLKNLYTCNCLSIDNLYNKLQLSIIIFKNKNRFKYAKL